MKVVVHTGLSLVLVLAPALCCCNARWIASTAAAAPSPPPACPHCPAPSAPEPQPSCCHAAVPSCCQDGGESAPPAKPAPAPSCGCADDRPAATTTAAVKPDQPAAAELLPVPAALGGALTPAAGTAHGGHDPPGVDAKSAALFGRHVLRC